MSDLLPLLPEPEHVYLSGGGIALRSLTTLRVVPDEPATRHIGEEIAGELARITGRPLLGPVGPAAGAGSGASLLLTIDPEQRALGEEGYKLSVGAQEIRLVAATAAGLFYAGQSLLQLFPISPAGDATIPCLEIVDRPRFAWRGMHLDVSRHFFPVDRILRFLELIAAHKINRFHWHLTDDQGWRIEIPRYPRLTEVGARRTEPDGSIHYGFYKTEDIRTVVAYAAERHITVVPEIEMPGHAMAALAAYPELSCTGGPFTVPNTWGIFQDVFCGGKEETFRLLGDVCEEVASLFPGLYIHIGGDECPTARWRDCPACRRRMTEDGLAPAEGVPARPEELQGYFIRRIAALPALRGRRLIGWDEIREGAPPPETIVMSWRGIERGREAAQAGHDVVICPADACYFDSYQGPRDLEPEAFPRDVSLEAVYDFHPVPAELSAEEESHILGVQGNIWTEHISTWNHLEYMAFPRTCALAEVAWSQVSRHDWNSFRDRLGTHLLRLAARDVRYRQP